MLLYCLSKQTSFRNRRRRCRCGMTRILIRFFSFPFKFYRLPRDLITESPEYYYDVYLAQVRPPNSVGVYLIYENIGSSKIFYSTGDRPQLHTGAIMILQCISILNHYIKKQTDRQTAGRDFVLYLTSANNLRGARWPAVVALRRAIAEIKQSWSAIGWVTKNVLCRGRASEGTLSSWSRLHLQSLAPTNPHWVMARSPNL
jgi:hypothetical protein